MVKRLGIGKIIINPSCLRLPPENSFFFFLFQVNLCTASGTDERRGERRNLPFSVTIGFLENVVATINVHYTVLEVKLPAVSAPCNLLKGGNKWYVNIWTILDEKIMMLPYRTDRRQHYPFQRAQKDPRP